MSLQHSSQRKRKWRIFLAKQKKKEIKREPSRRASRMGKQFTNRWHSPNSCGGCFAEWEAQPFAEINNKEKTKERRGWASLRYNSGTRGLGCAWFAELRAFCQCAVETFSHASAKGWRTGALLPNLWKNTSLLYLPFSIWGRWYSSFNPVSFVVTSDT